MPFSALGLHTANAYPHLPDNESNQPNHSVANSRSVLSLASKMLSGDPRKNTSFSDDKTYRKMNDGNTDKGIVVHIPTIHQVGNAFDFEKKVNSSIISAVFLSELNTLKTLHENSAKVICAEGMDENTCRYFNEIDEVARTNPEFQKVLREFEKLAEGMKEGKSETVLLHEMSGDGLKWFMDMGAPAVHVILNRLDSNAPKLYKTTTPELQEQIDVIHQAVFQSGNTKVQAKDAKLMFETREKLVYECVQDVLSKNKSEPVFLTYGEGHSFERAFAVKNAPQLYRKL